MHGCMQRTGVTLKSKEYKNDSSLKTSGTGKDHF